MSLRYRLLALTAGSLCAAGPAVAQEEGPKTLDTIRSALQAEGYKDFTVAGHSPPKRVTTRVVDGRQAMECIRVFIEFKLQVNPRLPAQKNQGTRDLVVIFDKGSVRSISDAAIVRKLAEQHGDQDALAWLAQTDGLARK